MVYRLLHYVTQYMLQTNYVAIHNFMCIVCTHVFILFRLNIRLCIFMLCTCKLYQQYYFIKTGCTLYVMGAREIIRIFMFSVLLIKAGHSFENISRTFL